MDAFPADVPQPERRGYALPIHRAVFTPLLLGANALIYVLMEINGGSTDPCTLLRFGAKYNALILNGEWWRLFTPIFLHIGISHLLFNEYALWSFGTEVEQLFGSPRFLTIYLISGLFGSVASFAFTQALSAGASGAIFGIIGAMTAFFLRNRERFGEVGRRQLSGLASIVAINLLLGFISPGIDNFGHLGGLASGFVLGYALAPVYALQVNSNTIFDLQVIDRNPFTRTLWVPVFALLILVVSVSGARTIAPVGRGDLIQAAQCYR